MITDVIVLSSLGLAAAFCLGWLVWPGMRAWIERPKYHFQANVRRYDRRRSGEDDDRR